MTSKTPQPSYFIPHGGGPCFFMEDPNNTWAGMEQFLRDLPSRLPQAPDAILVVSAHWETAGFRVTAAEKPPLIFDYYNFPPHTYELTFDAPGAPDIASRTVDLLLGAGFEAELDHERGWDHGVFIPLLVSWPDADVPVIEMSIDKNLDPELHVAAGEAIAPLRDQNVLIVGSGMSFHNLREFFSPGETPPSDGFDRWLTEAVSKAPAERAQDLSRWLQAPEARRYHPREEHLIPLMVAAGAGSGPGKRVYSERVMGAPISGYRFD